MSDTEDTATYREAFRDMVQFAKDDPWGALDLFWMILFFGPMFLAAGAYEWVRKNVF